MNVCFYISGHGFGHASRTTQVVNELTRLVPGCGVVIRTQVPRWFLDSSLRAPAEIVPVETDVGVVQEDSLSVDPEKTATRARDFYADFPARVDREARALRTLRVSLVVGDVPPLAFAAAARAAIPSIAMANFTWDWIYDAYPSFEIHAPGVIGLIRQAHAHAALALRLPFAGGFATFRRVDDVPLIARTAYLSRRDARDRLGLDEDGPPVVLASFGGHGLRLPVGAATADGAVRLLVSGSDADAARPSDARVRRLSGGELAARGLTYPDLVAAADVVLGKPGYGLVSECIANGASLLYAARRHFVEQALFVRDMPRVLRCLEIDREDLLAGRWSAAVRVLLSQPPPAETMRVDGARVAAERILDLARRTGQDQPR